MNAKALRTERRQADQATLIVDVLIGAALLVDAALMVDNPVPAVLTVALGLGVVWRVVVERSTAQAVFGE